MKITKLLFILLLNFSIAICISGCSKDNKSTPTIDTDTLAPLTQFEVTLGDQITSGTSTSRLANIQTDIEQYNNVKRAFFANDNFTFSYINAKQVEQKAYAHTSDAKTWTIHQTNDANSPLQIIQLNKFVVLSASYLSVAAINAGADKDGITTENITNGEMVVGCFDALHARAQVVINHNKATAKIPFKHINHLLNIYISGTINETNIDYLKLNITYTDATGSVQNAVLFTSKRANYNDNNGTSHTVIQAIVPRNAVVTNIQAIKNNNPLPITTSEIINISCPSGKSHLITLNVNNNTMSVQVGSLINDWVFNGEMNPDGTPVGDITINTETELRVFSEAVNTNPNMPGAKINGVLAYTAKVVQTADIDLSNLPWRPIGGNLYQDSEGDEQETYFAGTYNGNGYKISGMNITQSTTSGHAVASYGGLFGKLQSPTEGYTVLTNIKLINSKIQITSSINYSFAGVLVGISYAKPGKNFIVISQCSTQGTVVVNNSTGQILAAGVVGDMTRTHITGCTSDVTVTTNASGSSYAGGVVGQGSSSVIASSYAKQTVNGQSNEGSSFAGGIIGALKEQNELSYILACCSEGNITSNGNIANAGGIVGGNQGAVIGCYAKGNVTSIGNNIKAGAIADTNSGRAIRLCYGVGAIGAGNSNVIASPNNIVYNTAPATGDILSIVSCEAWKNANGSEIVEATVGGILTPISINSGGKTTQEVKTRLWVLSNANVWSTTINSANSTYPLPQSNYKGE